MGQVHRQRNLWAETVKNNTRIITGFLLTSLLPLLPSPSEGFSFAEIAPTLVHLRASANDKVGQTIGLTPQATGFFVSSEGLVLTTYHLIKPLVEKNADLETIRITASRKLAGNESVPTFMVDASISSDLLLLKMFKPQLAGEKIQAAKLGNSADVKISESHFTAGFTADGLDTTASPTVITTRSGKFWRTSVAFQAGQSGSPVFNADTRVVAIVKGNSGNPPIGRIIPIDFAEPLLIQVRLSEARASQKSLEKRIHKLEDALKTIEDK